MMMMTTMTCPQQQLAELMEDGTVRSPRWQQEVWNRQQHLLTLNFAERMMAYDEVDEREEEEEEDDDEQEEASDRFAAGTPRDTTPRSPRSSPRDMKKKKKTTTTTTTTKMRAPLRMKDVMRRPSNKSPRDQNEEARVRRRLREADVEAKADRIMGQVLAYARLHHAWRASLPAQPEREA